MKQVVDINQELIKKYNLPIPRYTSYPTVPYWKEEIEVQAWKDTFITRFNIENHTKGISLYIHLPFCESLCTYCGCNTRITVNHAVEEPYIETLLKEWKLYLELLPAIPVIKELHLGGGTPTFFSAANLEKLIKGILTGAKAADRPEFSLEGHPNHTTPQQLQALYNMG